jgi:hypothetical protein
MLDLLLLFDQFLWYDLQGVYFAGLPVRGLNNFSLMALTNQSRYSEISQCWLFFFVLVLVFGFWKQGTQLSAMLR